jgi:predicted nucleic acid-binding Zn ribbon protein
MSNTKSNQGRTGAGARRPYKARTRVMTGSANYLVGGAALQRPPLPVEQILRRALSKYGLDNEIARYRFVLHWKEIVGEEISKIAKPECIKNRALVVRVTDSAWAQELSFQKRIILARLKKFLGKDDVVDEVLFYVVGARG